jgi:hypothetical protein
MRSKDLRMAWNIEGNYVESCSCGLPCPCTASFDLGADLDYCRIALCFNLASGDVEGVDVGGLGVALFVDSPKVMTDGGWKVGLYIDDRASDEQANALTQVFSGALGGPPAALGPLLGEFLGVERASFEFGDDGLNHTVRIGDSVDIEIEDLVSFGTDGDPVKISNIGHVAGSTMTIARAKRAHVNAFGIEYEGGNGLSNSEFAWAG